MPETEEDHYCLSVGRVYARMNGETTLLPANTEQTSVQEVKALVKDD